MEKVWKNKIFQFVSCLLILGAFMTGCQFEETKFIFNNKTYYESDLEEHLADLLEVENTDIDIEVSITEEVDD